jgi:LAO/AO transport system kinase
LSASTLPASASALVDRLLAGDRGALARVITLIEREPEIAAQLDARLAPHACQAYTVGVTGAPGAGKSTLVGALMAAAIARDDRLAVLALDPVSPVSHGAILGDRLRMDHAAGDARTYVRSMTADAHAGGLSVVTPLVIRALDAAGWPWIVVETVGVGQSELDVVEAAATTVVVLNPGWGDEVQAVKAGLMEVADVFVINKADRDGAAETRRDLERLLSASTRSAWRPPIVDTIAHRGQGIDQLWAAIAAHRQHLVSTGALPARRRRFLALALRSLLNESLRRRIEALEGSAAYGELLRATERGEQSLPATCEILLDGLLQRR